MHFTGILLSAAFSVAVGFHVPQQEVHQPAQPYKFGYSAKDQHGEQHREESGDGHSVRGSYGFTDNRGIQRQVNYVADQSGFRAQIQTNEQGTSNQSPAEVQMMSSAQDASGSSMGSSMSGSYAQPPAAPMPAAPSMTKGYQYSSPVHGGYVSVYSN